MFGYWVLGIGYWVLGTGYWVLGTGYWVFVTGCELRVIPLMLVEDTYFSGDTGYWIFETGNLMISQNITDPFSSIPRKLSSAPIGERESREINYFWLGG